MSGLILHIGNIFQFQAPAMTPSGGFDFSTSNPTHTVEQNAPRGRGRGQQIPAWMQQT